MAFFRGSVKTDRRGDALQRDTIWWSIRKSGRGRPGYRQSGGQTQRLRHILPARHFWAYPGPRRSNFQQMIKQAF